MANADLYNAQVAKILFSGENTFMLNGSSNATGLASYTFDSVANTGTATNYQRLALTGNGSRWQSASLTIGSGGALLVSNAAAATVAAAITDAGTIEVSHSVATFASNVVISGRFLSDPSTNVFAQDLTLAPNGVIQGGGGDRFEFQASFFNHSTNRLFDLAASTGAFTTGVVHTNAVTSSDYGPRLAPGDQPGAYGALQLGSASDIIDFISGGGVGSNALYLAALILPGFDTNLVANLHSSFNIYYMGSTWSSTDAYLGDQTYALPGGGFLMPAIPEPSLVTFMALAAAILLGWRRR